MRPSIKKASHAIARMLAVVALSATTLAPVESLAQAEPWPVRPIRLICGYTPGTSPDMQARLIAGPLSKALGQPVIVENKPGAGGNIGADAVAKARDGHTIGIIGNGPLTTAKLLYSKLPYDPTKDFKPITLVGTAPYVWVAAKSAVTGSTAEYIKTLRAAGDKAFYGSIGVGSGGNLGMEIINQQLGLKMVHVPFPGGPQILTAMLTGDVQTTLLVWSTVASMVESGKMVAMAVSTEQRSPLLPDVPGLREIGVTGVNLEGWNAIMGPASMPEAHQARLNAEIAKILHSPEIARQLRMTGWAVPDTSIKALSERIQSDTATYATLIKTKGYKLD